MCVSFNICVQRITIQLALTQLSRKRTTCIDKKVRRKCSLLSYLQVYKLSVIVNSKTKP